MSELGDIAKRLRSALRLTASAINAVLLRPLTYLILYLVMIVCFAWLYETNDNAIFYAPYAKLELTSRKDYAAVEMNVFEAIYKANPLQRVDDTGWRLNSDTIDVSELAINETGDFSFTLSFFASHFTHGKEDLSLGGPVENIQVSRRLIYTPSDGFCRLVTLPPDWTRQPLLAALFKQSAMPPPMLCWGGDAERQFHQTGSGWSGNPKAFSGAYWRMLYLSAITITSVGYGDIVPISNTARLLCGLEAVLGWVIAGFFLSVLTIGRRRN
jgi:hypothetical protein